MTSSGPSCVVAPRNVCIVRCASGVTKIRQRAVGSPPSSRRRVVGHADGANVVAEHIAQLVVGDLADVRRATAERGDAGNRVAGGAARLFDARPHDGVEPFGRLRIDERHASLGQVVLHEERVVGFG